MFKDVINKNGVRTNTVIVDENDNILFSNLKLSDKEKLVECCDDFSLLKPCFSKNTWRESATEDEIKEHEEKEKLNIF